MEGSRAFYNFQYDIYNPLVACNTAPKIEKLKPPSESSTVIGIIEHQCQYVVLRRALGRTLQ